MDAASRTRASTSVVDLLTDIKRFPDTPVERLLEKKSGKRGLAAYLYLLSIINNGIPAQPEVEQGGGGARLG
jgi:hypothetical protein